MIGADVIGMVNWQVEGAERALASLENRRGVTLALTDEGIGALAFAPNDESVFDEIEANIRQYSDTVKRL